MSVGGPSTWSSLVAFPGAAGKWSHTGCGDRRGRPPSRATPLAPMPSSPLACREPYYPKTVKLCRRVCFPLVSHFFLRNRAATLWDCRSWAEEARRAAQLPEEGRQRSTSPKGLSGHTWCRTFWSVVVVAGLRVQQLGSVSDAGAWQTSEPAEGCFLSVLVGLLEASGMGVAHCTAFSSWYGCRAPRRCSPYLCGNVEKVLENKDKFLLARWPSD